MYDEIKKYPRSGPDVNAWKLVATDKNNGTLESSRFKAACERVGLEPTRRQASKYSKGLGLAANGRS